MKVLPDVMLEKSKQFQKLAWVGMTEIQSAMLVNELYLPVSLDVGVNLADNNRGIHMSRLYQLHQSEILGRNLSKDQLQKFTKACLQSHEAISDFTSVKLKLQWPMQTRSLKSDLAGFRQYPIQFIFEQSTSGFFTWLQFEILYSSTCPQSAGVSMEVIKAEREQSMNPAQTFERLAATPHAQRSRAVIKLSLKDFSQTKVTELIGSAESSLGTPVQTTVKKIDEMEFARLNANNLMFCEDAARKLANSLASQPEVIGFSVYCEHQESLHPHNASSLIAKNYSNPVVMSFSSHT